MRSIVAVVASILLCFIVIRVFAYTETEYSGDSGAVTEEKIFTVARKFQIRNKIELKETSETDDGNITIDEKNREVTTESASDNEPVEIKTEYVYKYVNVVTSKIPLKKKGVLKIKAYCECNLCDTKSLGEKKMSPYEGITAAANYSEFTYGTMVNIQDVGIRLIQSNDRYVPPGTIEIYFKSHKAVENFDIADRLVFIVQDTDEMGDFVFEYEN